uniref:Putative secreted protein n=1 Tax=Amblyomma cajennense TaxID=34607 RepID=A0A023FE63_AMBCJ
MKGALVCLLSVLSLITTAESSGSSPPAKTVTCDAQCDEQYRCQAGCECAAYDYEGTEVYYCSLPDGTADYANTYNGGPGGATDPAYVAQTVSSMLTDTVQMASSLRRPSGLAKKPSFLSKMKSRISLRKVRLPKVKSSDSDFQDAAEDLPLTF